MVPGSSWLRGIYRTVPYREDQPSTWYCTVLYTVGWWGQLQNPRTCGHHPNFWHGLNMLTYRPGTPLAPTSSHIGTVNKFMTCDFAGSSGHDRLWYLVPGRVQDQPGYRSLPHMISTRYQGTWYIINCCCLGSLIN